MHPSASFSAAIRVRIENHPGAFARLAAAIGEAGGLLGAIDLVRVEGSTKVRDVNVLADDEQHLDAIVAAVRPVEGVEVIHVSDRVFLAHLGGKLEVRPRLPLKTRDDLSMVYTPGVARVSRAIAEEPDKVWNLTIKRNCVAIVSDGTAVLGLGDIGPEAALPVMEGKAVLFKEFGDIDAFPICLATKDPDEIVRTVEAIAPAFGGINLEDISAPRCFEVERRLRERLEIPVFHDDQHGTAIVVLAALLNSLRVVGKEIDDVRIVLDGSRCCGDRGHARSNGRVRGGSSAATEAARSTAAGRASTPRSRSTPSRRTPRPPRHAPTSCSREPTSSSASPPPAQSPARAWAGWRRTRSSSRWPTRTPRSTPRHRGPRRGHRDRPQRLPEPDQQRARLPGRLPRRLDVRARTIDPEMELAAARAIAAAIRTTSSPPTT